ECESLPTGMVGAELSEHCEARMPIHGGVSGFVRRRSLSARGICIGRFHANWREQTAPGSASGGFFVPIFTATPNFGAEGVDPKSAVTRPRSAHCIVRFGPAPPATISGKHLTARIRSSTDRASDS